MRWPDVRSSSSLSLALATLVPGLALAHPGHEGGHGLLEGPLGLLGLLVLLAAGILLPVVVSALRSRDRAVGPRASRQGPGR